MMGPGDVAMYVFGAGGMLGGAVALFKLRPEVARVTVSAAEGAVIVQTSVIQNLQSEITRLHQEVAEERRNCDAQLAECNGEIERLRLEVKEMREVFTRIDERKGVRRGKLPTDINGVIPADREEKP